MRAAVEQLHRLTQYPAVVRAIVHLHHAAGDVAQAKAAVDAAVAYWRGGGGGAGAGGAPRSLEFAVQVQQDLAAELLAQGRVPEATALLKSIATADGATQTQRTSTAALIVIARSVCVCCTCGRQPFVIVVVGVGVSMASAAVPRRGCRLLVRLTCFSLCL